MSNAKPPLVRLAEMTAGQAGDFFALLVERTRGARKDGKPFYTCRFRDGGRTTTAMIWSDGDWYVDCERDWREGQFFKIRGVYQEHPTYGPQIELKSIRIVNDEDRAADFDPMNFIEHTRFDVDAMFDELWTVAETQIDDVQQRRLV